MSKIILKKNGFNFKDPETGEYVSIDVISDGKTSERIAAI